MIRLVDTIIGVYLGCGALVVTLCTLLVMTVWGHRHGMSLTEACNPTDCGKLTLRDWGSILFVYITWPCTLFISLQACLGYDNSLMEAIDRTAGYSEKA